MADWSDYFSCSRPPSNLEEAKRTIQDFSIKHRQLGRHVVLVTSGGTTVPLENNTVRYLDNFSQGTRGAASAEHFEGHHALDLLDQHLDTNGTCHLVVDESRAPGLHNVVRKYKEVQNACLLLKIGFMTLSDYLFLLKASAEALSALGPHVMFYLAAAVSDFFLPDTELPEHKIQSVDGSLQLILQPTPKLLSPLVKEWAKQAFVVSFKLETDMNIISRKAREALQKYNHQVVIANILQTRRKTVVLVTPYEENAIWMADNELDVGKEIEEKIVAELFRRHVQFIATSQDGASTPEQHTTFTPNQQLQVSSAPVSQVGNQASGVNSVTPLISPLGSKSVLLHMRINPDGTPVAQALPVQGMRRQTIKSESGLSFEIQEFIKYFKGKRMTLGYTQEDVGRELSEMNGPSYSQSFISRFEGKQLGMKAAERMRPILEAWVTQKEEEGNQGMKAGKKRRRRTCFSQEAQDVLMEHFAKNPKPTVEEIQVLANELQLEPGTIKVWFCNKKQNLKRQNVGDVKPDLNVMKSKVKLSGELDENSHLSANNYNEISGSTYTTTAMKQVVSGSAPAVTMATVPFILSQDGGVTIVTQAPHNGSTQSPQVMSLNLSTSLSPPVVLSQIPLLPTLSVVNQGIGGATLVSGAVSGSQQVLTARPLHTQAVLQIPHSHSGTSVPNSVVTAVAQQTQQLGNTSNQTILVADITNATSNGEHESHQLHSLTTQIVTSDISSSLQGDLESSQEIDHDLEERSTQEEIVQGEQQAEREGSDGTTPNHNALETVKVSDNSL